MKRLVLLLFVGCAFGQSITIPPECGNLGGITASNIELPQKCKDALKTWKQPKVEPMDVPAFHDCGCGCGCSKGVVCACTHEWSDKWTCEDKSRILLTAEDGTKHCIKFPQSTEPTEKK